MSAFDASTIKKQFPLLLREVNGLPLVYLDSANTTQKPQTVIDTMTTFMEQSYAPINRSAYHLAAAATDAYEGAREKLDESVPQVEKPELDANPNTYQFTLIEHFDGEYPVVRTFKSAELMALHIARLEGQNVTVTAFYGVVMRLTKGPTRYLTMPDRETALTVPHGGFGPSKRVELDLLGCLDVQEDGFLGDPELCEPATVVEKCEKQIRDVASRQAAGDEDDEDQDEDDEPPEDDDE